MSGELQPVFTKKKKHKNQRVVKDAWRNNDPTHSLVVESDSTLLPVTGRTVVPEADTRSNEKERLEAWLEERPCVAELADARVPGEMVTFSVSPSLERFRSTKSIFW